MKVFERLEFSDHATHRINGCDELMERPRSRMNVGQIQELIDAGLHRVLEYNPKTRRYKVVIFSVLDTAYLTLIIGHKGQGEVKRFKVITMHVTSSADKKVLDRHGLRHEMRAKSRRWVLSRFAPNIPLRRWTLLGVWDAAGNVRRGQVLTLPLHPKLKVMSPNDIKHSPEIAESFYVKLREAVGGASIMRLHLILMTGTKDQAFRFSNDVLRSIGEEVKWCD